MAPTMRNYKHLGTAGVLRSKGRKHRPPRQNDLSPGTSYPTRGLGYPWGGREGEHMHSRGRPVLWMQIHINCCLCSHGGHSMAPVPASLRFLRLDRTQHHPGRDKSCDDLFPHPDPHAVPRVGLRLYQHLFYKAMLAEPSPNNTHRSYTAGRCSARRLLFQMSLPISALRSTGNRVSVLTPRTHLTLEKNRR